jgi:hypothetical protein
MEFGRGIVSNQLTSAPALTFALESGDIRNPIFKCCLRLLQLEPCVAAPHLGRSSRQTNAPNDVRFVDDYVVGGISNRHISNRPLPPSPNFLIIILNWTAVRTPT